MDIRKPLWSILCLFISGSLWAQTSVTSVDVTDKQPANLDGLSMGYIIKSQEVKAVGNDGNFSRYAVRFFVTNTTNQAKIILYKQGWNILGNVSDQLVQFRCINATGARLTSKQAIINAPACNVLALVDDLDPQTNKKVQTKRFVQIGYWIKPGQTINTDAIVIVPLNEQPKVEATYLANQLQAVGSATYSDVAVNPGVQAAPIQYNTVDFVEIRNIANNTYINEETGTPTSSVIDAGWASAQWQLMPIPGSNNFYIKNRWKANYLGIDNGYVTITDNYSLPSTMWIVITPPNSTTVRFKNAQTGGYLSIAYNNLIITKPSDIANANWELQPIK